MERSKVRPRRKPKFLPSCPICSSGNTVGRVTTVKDNKYNTATKGYFCSNCLTEWDENSIKKPMYA